MAAFHWIALDVGIAEQSLLRRFMIAMGQADDDDMHMRLALGFTQPTECSMGKGDFQPVSVEQDRP